MVRLSILNDLQNKRNEDGQAEETPMTQRETTQVRQSSVSYKKNSTVSLENDISTPRSSAGVGKVNVRQGNTS